jgi:Na+/phosphate symporter
LALFLLFVDVCVVLGFEFVEVLFVFVFVLVALDLLDVFVTLGELEVDEVDVVVVAVFEAVEEVDVGLLFCEGLLRKRLLPFVSALRFTKRVV